MSSSDRNKKLIFYIRFFIRFCPFIIIVILITSQLQQNMGFSYTPKKIGLILLVILLGFILLFKKIKKVVSNTGRESQKTSIRGKNINEFYHNLAGNILNSKTTKKEYKYIVVTLGVVIIFIVLYFKTKLDFLNPIYYFRYFLTLVFIILGIYGLYFNLFKKGKCSKCRRKITSIAIDYEAKSVICPFCHAKTSVDYFFNLVGKYRYFESLLKSKDISDEEKEKIKTKIL